MDPLPNLALRPLELLINRGIRQSSTAQALATALEGKSLLLRVDGVPWPLHLAIAGCRLQVGGGERPEPPSAVLEGGPLSILALAGGDAQARIRDGNLRISGDTEVASQFRELLQMAGPDLEEELSGILGDPLAHQAGRLAAALTEWGSRAARSVARSVGEFVTEERPVLPTRSEVEAFYAEVDTVVAGVDRAEARLARLRRAVDQT